jgi:protein ImuA
MTRTSTRDCIATLRRRIAALEACDSPKPRAARAPDSASASAQAFFEGLPGNLAPGCLVEILPSRPRDASAAASFACALALRAVAARPSAVLWIVEDMAAREIGCPYAKGLEALGLDPTRLIVARTREPRESLWTMEEALKSGAAAIVAESWIAPEAYSLTMSRRLLLTARRGGGLGLLLLLRAHGQGRRLASAAHLRFEIAAPPPPAASESVPPLPGPLGWRLRLLKARADAARLSGQALAAIDAPDWRDMRFDPEKGAFRHAFPERLPAQTIDRPHSAAQRSVGA